MSDKQEYRGIMKGISIFGGVQVFNILINIVRGKFVALFLGPAGMGVSALLSSTVTTINQVSSLGLSMGAMRHISTANKNGDMEKLSLVAKIFRRLVFITGILGALISVIGSNWWSKIAFGTGEHTLAFIILGAMLFFTALGSGETALLQGTRRLKDLAKTTLIGSSAGLIIGVPLYYFWGTKGIAPAMVALALVTYLSNRRFARKINLAPVKILRKDMSEYTKDMVSLGVVLMAAQVLGTLAYYFVNWFIRYKGNIEDVGLYSAASSITTQYIGFVFSAMAVDYFPRLAAVSNDNKAVCGMVNQQMKIVMLIATPLIIAIIVTAPLLVKLLLSESFMVIIPVLRWMGLALFFKAVAFAMGYISFAKGDKKTFFYLESVYGSIALITCCVIGYTVWGYYGLGIANFVMLATYFFVISGVTYWKYQFKLDREVLFYLIILFTFCLAAFILSLVIIDDLQYGIIGGVILIVAGWYCLYELNKKMHIIDLIKSKIKIKRDSHESHIR